MLRRKLCSVRPINLVAVVLLRVVARGYVYACNGTVFAYGEAKLRRWTNFVENTDVYAVCRHNGSRCACKKLAVKAAVVADYYTALHCVHAFGTNNRGKGLRGVADNMSVHAV